MMKLVSGTVAAAFLLVLQGGPARAQPNPSMLKTFQFDKPSFPTAHPFAVAHVVIQISEADPARWALALNNAQNMLNYLGEDKVQIVIVAYGPGLEMLLANSKVSERVASMATEGVEFDACHNTMEHMAKTLGHMPALVPAAVIVPSGVVRAVQLESHGFTYIKP